jgi:hypothetical protein
MDEELELTGIIRKNSSTTMAGVRNTFQISIFKYGSSSLGSTHDASIPPLKCIS